MCKKVTSSNRYQLFPEVIKVVFKSEQPKINGGNLWNQFPKIALDFNCGYK
jgi:hypothetical protein